MFKEHLLLAVCQSSNYCVHVKGSTFYAVPNFKGFLYIIIIKLVPTVKKYFCKVYKPNLFKCEQVYLQAARTQVVFRE